MNWHCVMSSNARSLSMFTIYLIQILLNIHLSMTISMRSKCLIIRLICFIELFSSFLFQQSRHISTSSRPSPALSRTLKDYVSIFLLHHGSLLNWETGRLLVDGYKKVSRPLRFDGSPIDPSCISLTGGDVLVLPSGWVICAVRCYWKSKVIYLGFLDSIVDQLHAIRTWYGFFLV
jgi:hypothetical protein